MKKFTKRIQRLSRQAAELRQVVESVPAKVAEIRDAAALATGHVQKLRADIVSSVATLRAENDMQLVTALHEIDRSTDVIAEAGFRLHGVDMDLGTVRRLIVHLERVDDVDADAVRGLLNANAQRPALQALLAALLKAEELADKVDLDHLSYTQLTVEVGLIPSVRIGWRAEAPRVAQNNSPQGSPSVTAPVVAPSIFFERRPTPTPAAPSVPTEVSAPAPETTPPAEATVLPHLLPGSGRSAGDDWRLGALDRFKKMPDLTKRTR